MTVQSTDGTSSYKYMAQSAANTKTGVENNKYSKFKR